MRRGAIVVACLTVGCTHREPAAPRQPTTERCTVRVLEKGLLVDGERMSRGEAVDYCKRAAGGAVVVMEHRAPTRPRDEMQAALEREGVRVYVRGDLCSGPDPMDCRPRLPPDPTREPRPTLVTPAPGPAEPRVLPIPPMPPADTTGPK